MTAFNIQQIAAIGTLIAVIAALISTVQAKRALRRWHEAQAEINKLFNARLARLERGGTEPEPETIQ